MAYPVEILPNPKYKRIEDELNDYCLIRHSHLTQETLLDEFGKLKDVAIATEKLLPDYSTSLYGVFNEKHITIRITNPDYLEYCEPDAVVRVPTVIADYTLVEDRGYWTIPIKYLNNQEISYHDNDFKATCHVRHTPMRWNYWHFSLRWFIHEEDAYWFENEGFQTKSIRRRLVSEIRSMIKEYGKAKVICDGEIPEKLYKKEH